MRSRIWYNSIVFLQIFSFLCADEIGHDKKIIIDLTHEHDELYFAQELDKPFHVNRINIVSDGTVDKREILYLTDIIPSTTVDHLLLYRACQRLKKKELFLPSNIYIYKNT